MTERRDLVRLGLVVVALLAVTGVIMLATQGGSGSSGQAQSAQVDGIVADVTANKLVLRAQSGTQMTFEIRQVDQPSFDVFHLKQHAADGLLTRVTYVREDGRQYALRADDAPQPNTQTP